MRFGPVVAASFCICALSACGVLLDFDPPDPNGDDASTTDFGTDHPDASTDGGLRDLAVDLHLPDLGSDFGVDMGHTDFGPDAPISPCATLPDGSPCPGGLMLTCIAGECVASRCGDGFVDTSRGEQCEPSASDPACDPATCRYPCVGDGDCLTGMPLSPCATPACSGHFCVIVPSGAVDCTTTGGTAGTCMGTLCASDSCGDGVVTTGEECDGTPGCTTDCHFECHSDSECNDGDGCNGIENCVAMLGGAGGTTVIGRSCSAGPTPTCVAADSCSTSMCVSTGPLTHSCPSMPIDADGDGFAVQMPGVCGTDCDDTNPFIHPGAPEICNSIDDDCNGLVDDGTTPVMWCPDLDGDGSGAPSGAVVACASPGAGFVRDCHDCYDTGAAAERSQAAQVHPGQDGWFDIPYCPGGATASCSYDYDCSGSDELEFPGLVDCSLLLCAGLSGWDTSVPGCGMTGTLGTCHTLIRLLCSESRAPGTTQGCH